MSDSKVQREAEEIIFENLKSKLKCNDLQSNVRILISKENNIWICLDFYSEENHIIGEIHTHLGKLKSAQLHKIEGDILKMPLVPGTVKSLDRNGALAGKRCRTVIWRW